MNLLPLAVGAAIYFASRGNRVFNATNAFQYAIQKIPDIKIQAGKVLVFVPIGISNITGEAFDVRKVYGQLFVRGQYIGDFTKSEQFRIAANGNTSVTVVIEAFLTNTIAALISALTAKAGDTEITLKGVIVTSFVDVPLSVTKKV